MSQQFPQVGLRAVFEITQFNRNYNRYQSLMRDIDRTTQQTAQKVSRSGSKLGEGFATSTKEFVDQSKQLQDALSVLDPSDQIRLLGELGDRFAELGPKARVNVDLFDRLESSGVGMAEAFSVASGQVAFSIETFDRMIRNGAEVEEAFQGATRAGERLSSSVNILGRSFSTTAIAIGASVAALRIGIRIVQESNEAYDELAEATRNVRLQTGLLTREASTWVTVAETSGVSTGTATRAMAQFLSKVADLRRDMQQGNDLTSDFAVAMNTLGISVVNSQGNLRTTEAILNDVDRAFTNLGPGITSAQLAQDIFGRSGVQLLPILTDQEQSLSDLSDEVTRYGASLGAIDRQQFEELRNSQTRLKESTQGLKLEMARGWAQVRTNINNTLADIINFVRKADAAIRAFQKTFLTVEGQMTPFRDLGRLYQENLQFFLTGESESARAAEESAQARANAAQEIAASEGNIRSEREKTLKQLDEIKARLNQKLEDIDRDAEQRWDDILVQRQRDAIDRAIQLSFRLEDLRQAYNERLDGIEADFAQRWDDILVKRQRDAIVRGIRLAQRFEDLLRDTEQRRSDAQRAFDERRRKQEQDVQQKIQDVERDAQERREKAERDHQRKLRDIQLKFLDTALEAARRNDAVAVAQAQRRRSREIRDEQQRYSDERGDLERALQERREDIQRDRQEREQEQRDELARTLQRIDENYARQREALVRQNEQERLLRELRYQWEEEDFNAAKERQLQAAQEWYDKQLEELEKSQKREEILRKLQYERQEIDFVKAWQRRIEEAQTWYERERDELAEHLKLTGQQLEFAYEVWAREAAAAATQVAQAAADAVASEIIRYQHLLTETQRQAARAYTPTQTTVAPQAPLQTRRNAQGVYVPVIPGAPILSQAEGGVVQASRPTNVIMGDAGPETAVFLPGGGSRSMNVNHNFGRLGVDFQGLPGGMNTQQVQGIVYATMVQLAKGIQVPR